MTKIIGRQKRFDEAVEFIIDKINLGKKCFVVSTEYGRIFIEVLGGKPTISHKPYLTKWDDAPTNKVMIPYLRDKTIDFYAQVRKYRSDVLMENEIVQVLAEAAIRKLCSSCDCWNYTDVVSYKWLCYSRDVDYSYGRSMAYEWRKEFFSSWVDQVFHSYRTEDTIDFIETSLNERQEQLKKRIEKLTIPYRCDVCYDMSTDEFDGFEVVLFIIAATAKGIRKLPDGWAKKLAAANNRAACILELIEVADNAEKENKEKVNEEQ